MPAYVPAAQIYAFDLLDAQEPAELRSEARDVALALGCNVAAMVSQADSKWLVADTDSARWGEEISLLSLEILSGRFSWATLPSTRSTLARTMSRLSSSS